MHEKNRTEAFSDGVFAIAITLLILEVKVPSHLQITSNEQLTQALRHLWPSFLALFTSFATILVMWINHHGLFTLLSRLDNRVLFANGFLLLVVTFIPFPTALLAEHLAHEGARTAAVFYCSTYIFVNIAYNCLFAAAVAGPGRIKDGIPAGHLEKIRFAYRCAFFVYLAAAIVAWFHPLTGVLMCTVLWVLWMRLDYSPNSKSK